MLKLEDRLRAYQPFFDGWFLDGEIGHGQYGCVYTIFKNDLRARRYAAMKIIPIPKNDAYLLQLEQECGRNPQRIRNRLIEDFNFAVNEIRMLDRLNGISNIVYFEQSAAFQRRDTFGWDILIRMEKLVRLDNWLLQNPSGPDAVLRIWVDLIEGLRQCQLQNICHMDVKPANVFYSPNIKYFKLGDFGEAQYFAPNDRAGEGYIIGTYDYMAPEVRRGEGANRTSDVYSLGVMIYELLNGGRLPLQKDGPDVRAARDLAVDARMSGAKIPKIRGVNRKMMAALSRCLQFDPARRFPDAGAAAQTLIQLANNGDW